MNEFQLIAFLRKCGEDLLIPSCAVFLSLTILYKLKFMASAKLKNYVPYMLGIVFYSVYSLLILKNATPTDNFNLGITCGGIACVLFNAFFNRDTDFTDKIECILVLIITTDKVNTVAKQISKIKHSDRNVIEKEIKSIITDCRKDTLSEEEEKLLVSLLADILSKENNVGKPDKHK